MTMSLAKILTMRSLYLTVTTTKPTAMLTMMKRSKWFAHFCLSFLIGSSETESSGLLFRMARTTTHLQITKKRESEPTAVSASPRRYGTHTHHNFHGFLLIDRFVQTGLRFRC